MTTDTWERVKAAFAGLMRRNHPGLGDAADAELEAARQEVLAGRQAGDEQAGPEVTGEWRVRLRRLVAGNEQLQDELRRLVDEFGGLRDGSGQTTAIVMRATASGSARVNQAGRDQTVTGG